MSAAASRRRCSEAGGVGLGTTARRVVFGSTCSKSHPELRRPRNTLSAAFYFRLYGPQGDRGLEEAPYRNV
jgi:hypothetical protein